MIKSFKHKGLGKFYWNEDQSKIPQEMVERLRRRLSVLREAEKLMELNIPGFDFHPLQGKPKRYSIHVNGPWCLIFEWEKGHALNVDLVNYH